jgi:hypothetical protein
LVGRAFHLIGESQKDTPVKTALEVIELTIANQVKAVKEALHDATHEGDLADPRNAEKDILIDGMIHGIEDLIERFAKEGLLKSLMSEAAGPNGETDYEIAPLSMASVLPTGTRLNLTVANRYVPFSAHKNTWFDFFAGKPNLRYTYGGVTTVVPRIGFNLTIPLSVFSPDA